MRQALLLAVPIAAISGLAYFLTAHGCSTDDGTFLLTSSSEPTAYCQATGLFPPAGASVPSVVVDVILFASPALSVLVAGLVCARRGRELWPKVAVYACFIAPLTLLLSALADVSSGGPYGGA